MKTPKIVCLDPGHGMSNKTQLVYDSGTVAGGVHEATVAMDFANELRTILMREGVKVIRTRVDDKDPAPVSRRDDIAKAYGCELMVSLHCNFSGRNASGAETYYRGADDKAMARLLTDAVAGVLNIPNRGPKLESQSQHSSLAVLEFDKCWLIELGFLDNASDRGKLLNPTLRRKTCEAIAKVLMSYYQN